MADRALKVANPQEPRVEAPQEAPPAALKVTEAPQAKAPPRRLRFMLLVVIPLLAAAGGLYLYLAGGRYISTDNAYVSSQKVLITPDISGKISAVRVREGERVSPGQPLFEIDAEPFRLAVQQAEARIAGVRTDFATLKSNLAAVE
ncbi:MAG: biotin/lipoyl-binding protein, partial [Variibacter sp.]|nr:biotin/lipoyl-binding protein [Variibacter sp.]